jgi:hypothetical protein
MYLTMVEGYRPDVDLILQGVGGADLQPLRFNPDSEPLFFTHHPNWNLPALEIVPVGLVFQVRRAGQSAGCEREGNSPPQQQRRPTATSCSTMLGSFSRATV